MKIRRSTIILIVLLLPLISFVADSNAEDVEIKITHWDYTIIDDPFYNGGFTDEITDALDDFHWIVNDQEYYFTTILIVPGDIKNINDRWYLSQDYDVHILDGESPDSVKAARSKRLRTKLNDYIRYGGGYIGRCGGCVFPLPLFESPNTPAEAFWIESNSFIRDMNTYADMKTGFPVISEYFTVKKPLWNWWPIPRFKSEPEAIGFGGYTRYQPSPIKEPGKPEYNNQSKMVGVPVKLIDLDTSHPILKGYYNDTLFVKQLGGCGFIVNNENVDILASFDLICEDNPDHEIFAWSYSPIKEKLKIMMKLVKFIYIDNQGGCIAVDDLPPEWKDFFEGQEYVSIEHLFSKVIEDWGPWNKTDVICEANIHNASTVIAFEYGNNDGRVVLFGPHLFGKVWYVGEIVNSEDESLYLYESPYHWAYDNGTWITDGSINIIRDDNSKYWYQRREAAWAAKVIDEHLPPVYNRSQVVEISPKLQDSENFTIFCCVGRPPDEKDIWNK